jgi:hypothetical protein
MFKYSDRSVDATKILSRRELASVLTDLAKRGVRSRQARLNRVIPDNPDYQAKARNAGRRRTRSNSVAHVRSQYGRTGMCKLCIFPCLDSEQMAASRRRELNISRDVAAALGRSSVEAVEKASMSPRPVRKLFGVTR